MKATTLRFYKERLIRMLLHVQEYLDVSKNISIHRKIPLWKTWLRTALQL